MALHPLYASGGEDQILSATPLADKCDLKAKAEAGKGL